MKNRINKLYQKYKEKLENLKFVSKVIIKKNYIHIKCNEKSKNLTYEFNKIKEITKSSPSKFYMNKDWFIL